MSTPKRIFIITGDASGDIHAAKVVRHLRTLSPGIEIEAVGGKQLAELGVPLLEDQSKMGRIGMGIFTGAPYHYFLGRRIMKRLKDFKPDAVLHIDYGVFNLHMAKQIKKRGIKTLYFIPPQVWASRKGRIKKIKANVDHVFCIFPFEESMYQEAGIPVTYVGHPLMGELPEPVDRMAFCMKHGLDPEKPIVGMFPGSRKMEIDHLLMPVIQSIPLIRKEQRLAQFMVAKAPNLDKEIYDEKLLEAVRATSPVPCVYTVENENHALMSVADVLIMKSGTGTLEAALYKKPMIIIYKGGIPIYIIARIITTVKCFGLPNILTDQDNPIVKELLQYDVTPEKIAEHVLPLFNKESEPYKKAVAGYDDIRKKLDGNAPLNVAKGILAQIEGDSAGPQGASNAESGSVLVEGASV